MVGRWAVFYLVIDVQAQEVGLSLVGRGIENSIAVLIEFSMSSSHGFRQGL